MKHISGPWKVRKLNDPDFGFEINTTDNKFLAICDVHKIQMSLERCQANAELIARAPKLLEENESLKKELADTQINLSTVDQINKELLGSIEELMTLTESYHCQIFGVDALDVTAKSGNTNHPLNKSKSLIAKAKL